MNNYPPMPSAHQFGAPWNLGDDVPNRSADVDQEREAREADAREVEAILELLDNLRADLEEQR